MEKLSINNIQKKTALSGEIEYERATSLYLKLRKLEKENSSYTSIRKQLRKIIKEYENAHWADNSKISDEQIKESDLAESLIRAENEFSQKRKELIKDKLKSNGLNQNDFAKILGHTKGYTSELINGLRPFSKEDVVIINRLFKIELSYLIPTFIKQEKAARIKKTLSGIPTNKIKLTENDFDLKMA